MLNICFNLNTHNRTVAVVDAQFLLVEVLDVHNLALVLKQGIEKRQQDGLGELLPKDALKADVGERVDEL